ncbi:rRNA maturation RNase YbeY [Autumnicola psychrophila]|uniref:Endoribonuclease YbeY n=1 Tax=Autumnicola psychrophila TaxID=3075592 RepID=A0ABU3DPR2_9FLAO|nr:rRNA maturation RNase YbeY [Zunongwangia sp. F225]MDT0685514.1 rRNA maturation RNase YbeY [Zunongwangia sp. F225]
MINFYGENDFELENKNDFSRWIEKVIYSEEKKLDEISFIFCNDEYLHKINLQYLNHDTFTDIISFDNTVGNLLGGDIFISTDRVAENAMDYNVDFDEELKRVIIHGVLHLCGYKDKSESESALMRQKENEKMELFHVEQ